MRLRMCVPLGVGMMVVGSSGCSDDADPPGHWLAGDLHVHSSVASNDTDGRGTPEVLAAAMAAAGLDFLFLTDHSNAAGSMHCDDVEDCPNLGPEVAEGAWPAGVVPASEISPIATGPIQPRGHVGCLPRGEGFVGLDHFVDRPDGAVTGGSAVTQCQEAGGFAIVNHPFGIAPWIRYDWTSASFDAIEVYNGGARWDNGDAEALADWEARWWDRVPVGGSDCHRWSTPAPGSTLDAALGWPVTHVNLRGEERPIDGLRAGRVVVAEPGSSLQITARHRREAAGPGDALEGPATVTVVADAAVDGLRLEVRGRGGGEWVTLATAPVRGPTRVEVEDVTGPVYARMLPEEGSIGLDHAGVAFTAPVWVGK